MSFSLLAAPTNDLRSNLEEMIADNKVILFMKGTPERPACSFSERAAQALVANGVEFVAVDILSESRLRQELSSIAHWPTIPQLFVDGRLVGGADIIDQLDKDDQLTEVLSGQGFRLIERYEDQLG